jgi:translation initiation factor 1
MLHKVSQKSNSYNLLAYFLLFLYPPAMPKDDYHTVWSSEQGDLRKQKTQATRVKSLPPNQQTAYLHRESKGRGGKTVSLVKNLILSDADLKSLLKRLKQACGSGGTVKDGLIEIQGEHRQTIAEVLKGLGYKVKIAGG